MLCNRSKFTKNSKENRGGRGGGRPPILDPPLNFFLYNYISPIEFESISNITPVYDLCDLAGEVFGAVVNRTFIEILTVDVFTEPVCLCIVDSSRTDCWLYITMNSRKYSVELVIRVTHGHVVIHMVY